MRYPLAVSLLLLLAACSGQDQGTAQPAPVPDTSSAVDVAAQVAADGVALPGGVRFDVPSHLRDDKTYETKAGATRRKLTYELLSATPSEAESVVTQQLVNAGYAAGEPKQGKKGQYEIRYKKKKAPTIAVTFFPGLAKKPANLGAQSMVALSWQTKAAPKKDK